MIQKVIANIDKKVPIRREDLHGKQHIVVPMIMLTEGVHNGSGGPIFYESKDLKKSESLWNHKPVVVYHPLKKDGTPKTACDPNVLNTSSVGIILNTKEEGGKLKAEAWLDEEKTKLVDNRIIDAIEKEEMMEVSTGLYVEEESTKGVWNKEQYSGIARDYQPDHLAILPDQKGACSINDGAGLLRVNQEKNDNTTLQKTIEGLPVGIKLVDNVLSFDKISSELSSILSSTYGEKGRYWDGWLREVFPDKVVFGMKGDYYQVTYTVKNDKVVLGKDLAKVKVVTSYQVINKEPEMSQKFDKKLHIDNLISNGVYTEAERTDLEKIPDNILSGMKVPEKKEEKTPVANKEEKTVPVLINNDKKTLTEEEWWATAPAGMKEQFLANKQVMENQKQELITKITTNTNNPFTPEFLKTKTIDELKGLAQLSGAQETTMSPQMFFGGAAGGPAFMNNTNSKAPQGLKIPKIEYTK